MVCGQCGGAVGVSYTEPGVKPAAPPPSSAAFAGTLPGIVARAKGIVTRPAAEWAAIAAEPISSFEVLTGYAAPLAAIGAVALFIGQVLIGLSVPLIGIVRASALTAIATGVLLFALSLLVVIALGLIVNLLAPRFGGERNGARAFKVAAYSHTPIWLAGIAYALPWIGFLWIIAGLYGLFIGMRGLPVMMRCPKERAPAYALAAGACGFVLFAIVGSVIAMLTGFGPDLTE